MNVYVTRGAGAEVSVPLEALNGFRVQEDIQPERPKERRYRLTALILCTDLPEGEPFGHSCLHGPPPHLIRVIVRPDRMSKHGTRSLPRLRRLRHEVEALAEACRVGQVFADA